jgi:hypothetical protein
MSWQTYHIDYIPQGNPMQHKHGFFLSFFLAFTLIASLFGTFPVAAAPISALPPMCYVGMHMYKNDQAGPSECTLLSTRTYGIVLNGSINGLTNSLTVRLTDSKGNTTVPYFWLLSLPKVIGSEQSYIVPGLDKPITIKLKNMDTRFSVSEYSEISEITGVPAYVPTDMACISGLVAIAAPPDRYDYYFPKTLIEVGTHTQGGYFTTQLKQKGTEWLLLGSDKFGDRSVSTRRPLNGDTSLNINMEISGGKYSVTYKTHYCGGNIHALSTYVLKR